MKRILIWLLVVGMAGCFCVGQPVGALEIADVQLADTLTLGSDNLVLNGGGIRTKFFIKLYVAGLYLKQKSQDENQIMAADEPMAIRLHMKSSRVTKEKLKNALEEGFTNATQNNTAPIQDHIATFTSYLNDEVKEGDVFEFAYQPGKGTAVKKNGQLKGTVPGLEFKKALFGIWLCDKPADKSLKKGMLGK